MGDERSDQTKPSWKRGGRPAERPKKTEQAWKQLRVKPPQSAAPRTWRYKVTGGVLLFLASLLLIVFLIWLLVPPKPVGVVLVGADYANNLTVPHNVAGWRGLKAIESFLKSERRGSWLNPASLRLLRAPKTLESKEEWGDLINDLLNTKGADPDTILFVVALHGGSDSRGAYLMPNQMAGPEDALLLSDVIESMARLPEGKQKILVVEGAQITANWRLGMLDNRFVAELKAQEPAIRNVRNLWVLSGCDDKQRCWASEGLGRTVFLHYLIDALRGRASGRGAQLTLEDLHKYVSSNVANWAWHARQALQDPILLPEPEANHSDAKRPASNKVLLATVDRVPDPTAAPEMDRKTATEAWKRFHDLDVSVNHPAFFAPRRWREYRTRLVRSEELARAGAADRAGASFEQVRLLDSKLRSELDLKKLSYSIENTLAINVIQGGAFEPAPVSTPEFLAFWQAQTRTDAVKEWEKIQADQAGRSDDSSRSVRCRMYDFLLQYAVKDCSPGNVKKVAERLAVVKGPGYPYPAEAHFVRMLQGFLDRENPRPASSPFWRVAEQALRLRREAERAALGLPEGPPGAYPYCEQVHPWIKAQLEKADEQRRAGEDRLFSSEEQAWEEALGAFQKSRELYKKAVTDAAVVRKALLLRDRVLADLPEYSHWLSQRHSDHELDDELPDNVEKLWTMIHELNLMLETPDATAPAKLAEISSVLSKSYAALLKQFEQQKTTLEQTQSPEDWVAYMAAAAVPFADSADLELRTAIWDRLDVLRKTDFELYMNPPDPEPSSGGVDWRTAPTRRRYRRVRIEARMALAALGQRWYEDKEAISDQEEGDYRKNLERVGGSVPDENEILGWMNGLVKAGQPIGQRWRQMNVEIEKLVDESNGIPEDLVAFQTKLKKAERLARSLDSGAPVLPDAKVEASAYYRRTRVHDLLLWMAERTWRNHWYDEDPRGMKHYFRVAGDRFIMDAEAVFPGTTAVRKMRDTLNQKGEFELEGAGPLLLTSERSLAAKFRVVAPEMLRSGTPVIKPVVSPMLRLNGRSGGYQVVTPETSASGVQFDVSRPLLNPETEFDPLIVKPRVDPATLTVTGWFRGQPFQAGADVAVHVLPEVIAAGLAPPDPPQAGLSVRANQAVINRFGEGTGAVAIVLDCSGSMGADVGTFAQFKALPSKFQEAKQALNTVLTTIPEGTQVSVWIFGQARAEFRNINAGQPIDMQQRNDPALTIQRLRALTPWKRNQQIPLMRELDQVWPFFGTPLIKTMLRARDELLQAKGLKTLLVLTDGNDSEYEKANIVTPATLERNVEGRDNIHKLLRQQFNQQGISVNMVFFRVSDPKELKQADQVFQVIKTLDPPGQIYRAENLPDLVVALTRLIRQRLTCEIFDLTAGKSFGEPVAVTGPLAAEQWSQELKAGLYSLRVRADQTYAQDVELARDDRMIVQLVEGSGGELVFERALYGNDHPDAVKEQRENERLTLLGPDCKVDHGNKTRMLLILESTDNRAPRLRQLKPRWTWFDLSTKGAEGEPAFAVRWRERALYPAPAWQFDVPEWVADPGGMGLSQPVVRAWWSAGSDQIPVTRTDLTAFENLEAIDHKEQRLEGGKTVVIESVKFEDHGVEHRAGESLSTEHCMVVRLDLGKDGDPVLVDPERLREDGIGVVGYEHRIYTRARKYTGLFWPVTREQTTNLKRLFLVPIGQLRADAEKRSTTLELKNLSRPLVRNSIPDPPGIPIPGN